MPRSDNEDRRGHSRTSSTAFDTAAAEAFAARMVGVLNEASLALMISIGHQVGLFDVMAACRPAPPPDRRRGLQERYVREWLAP